jgi:hypothetical protein
MLGIRQELPLTWAGENPAFFRIVIFKSGPTFITHKFRFKAFYQFSIKWQSKAIQPIRNQKSKIQNFPKS